ncbi:MAG: hypothetical protein J6U06_08695 [Spirochaetaceae bacterium]|nr:hypothetical protein [Spirochaetaceae bacterium]
MKKIILIALISLIAVSAFAAVFPNAEAVVEDFWNRGNYIKIIKDKNNIAYYAKSTISGINIDEDDMEIATIGYDIWSGKNGDSTSFNSKRWNFSTDANGNIIISKK